MHLGQSVTTSAATLSGIFIAVSVLVALALLLIQAFVAAEVWTGKGGSYLAGFLLGPLLGPLGLYLVAFGRPGRDPCRWCLQIIPKNASSCWACGAAVRVDLGEAASD